MGSAEVISDSERSGKYLNHSHSAGSWTCTLTVPTRAMQVCMWRLVLVFMVGWGTLMLTRLPDNINDVMNKSTHSSIISTRGFIRQEDFSSRIVTKESKITNQPPNSKQVSRLFNDSCPVDYLGLTRYVSSICNNLQVPADIEICNKLTCRNILKGSSKEFYNQTRHFMNKYPMNRESDRYFIDITSNCSDFLEKRGYNRKMQLTEGADFPLAYNLIVHRRVETIERLLYALYRPQNQFCIHMDANSSPEFQQALRGIAKCLSPNVFIASKLEKIIYGGYSRLQADINCLKDHYESGRKWFYVLNTAGEAFPLRTQEELVKILRIYNGVNDVEGIYGNRLKPRRYLFENEYIEFLNTSDVGKTGRVNPPPPHDLDIVKGSVYAALSRGFVEFVLTDQRAIDFLSWSAHTYSPDELYWATLQHRFANPHIRPPGSVKVYPSQRHFTAVYANWGSPPCRGKYIHYICVNGVEDLPFLTTRRELFVNKFYSDFEPLALDCMRAWLEHRDFCPVELNFDFYHEVAHRDDIT